MTVQKGFYHYIITDKMDLYRRCLEHCESLLQDDLEKWERDWLETTNDFEDEYTRNQFDQFVHGEHADRLEFQSIVLSTFFLAAFAMFEHELIGFCRRAKQHSNSQLSMDNFGTRSPTEKAKKYLKSLGVDFPANSPEWSEITRYREIRNGIMHKGGTLRSTDSIAEYASKKDLLATGGEFPELALTKTFYEEAVNNMGSFLCKVVDAYEAWRKSAPEEGAPTV